MFNKNKGNRPSGEASIFAQFDSATGDTIPPELWAEENPYTTTPQIAKKGTAPYPSTDGTLSFKVTPPNYGWTKDPPLFPTTPPNLTAHIRPRPLTLPPHLEKAQEEARQRLETAPSPSKNHKNFLGRAFTRAQLWVQKHLSGSRKPSGPTLPPTP